MLFIIERIFFYIAGAIMYTTCITLMYHGCKLRNGAETPACLRLKTCEAQIKYTLKV